MTDNFFNTLVSALIAVSAIVAGTNAVQAERTAAAPHETTLAAQEIVTFPAVTVTGHDSSEAVLAAEATDNKVAVAPAWAR